MLLYPVFIESILNNISTIKLHFIFKSKVIAEVTLLSIQDHSFHNMSLC